MAFQTDPFQSYKEMLDPRVAADLGGWAQQYAPKAVTQTDRTLEGWVERTSEADVELLEGLGERMSGWTTVDSEAAGFALATWTRLEGVATEEWFADYRHVLGNQVIWDIEARAAYRWGQLEASSEESVRTWAEDRWDEASPGVPAVFTAFDGERQAMQRAAHQVAAARELRSRELGITLGPTDDLDNREYFSELHPGASDDDYLTFAAPAPPVRDPVGAVGRHRSHLWALGDRGRPVELNATSIVESCAAFDLESLDTACANLASEIPRAALVATKGRFPVPAGVRESLRAEHAQEVAAGRYIEEMGKAGELRWGSQGPSDPGERTAMHDRALRAATRARELVAGKAAELDRQREQGQDAALWFASDECDELTRGFAMYAVRKELELERARDAGPKTAEVGIDEGISDVNVELGQPQPGLDLGM